MGVAMSTGLFIRSQKELMLTWNYVYFKLLSQQTFFYDLIINRTSLFSTYLFAAVALSAARED